MTTREPWGRGVTARMTPAVTRPRPSGTHRAYIAGLLWLASLAPDRSHQLAQLRLGAGAFPPTLECALAEGPERGSYARGRAGGTPGAPGARKPASEAPSASSTGSVSQLVASAARSGRPDHPIRAVRTHPTPAVDRHDVPPSAIS